jgi:ABC-type branched-subunit amino acid transport system substrate-binding protein
MNMKAFSRVVAALLLIVLCSLSCSDDKDVSSGSSQTQWLQKTVAVILPMDDSMEHHWKRTLNKCAEDLKAAFEGQETGIELNYEWYDENTEDVAALSEKLAKRKDVVAVIGGLYSDKARLMASKLCRTSVKKPFFTLATAEGLVRGYSEAGCMWAMTETDISQCEVLLLTAYSYGGRSVSLIADGNSLYGKTFVDWISFQADEMGIELKGVYDYGDSPLSVEAAKAAASGADYVICAPSTVSDIDTIQTAINQRTVEAGIAPECLYSDMAFGEDALTLLGDKAEGIEGVAVGADPSSGFDTRYEMANGERPIGGEAQAYDAATMIGYALFLQETRNISSLNEAVKTLVDGRDSYIYSPTQEGMRTYVAQLAAGNSPDLRGVSGTLNFDKLVYTNVLTSTYYHYKVYGGKYIILDYISNDGSAHTSSSLANWRWQSTTFQEFEDNDQSGITYPERHEKWALLVAASSGWNNYRHQSDILCIYQTLRGFGYKDDHIVLISEDDIANNPENPNPGTVVVQQGGPNLYQDVHIDYHPSDISPSDIKSILCGERSDKLPQVISADSDDNVFVYWSGHGSVGQLEWLKQSKGFTRELAAETFKAMYEKKCYRKALFMIEACHSGSVFDAIVGYPGMLALTAARANETSQADVYEYDLDIWLSNQFTRNFRNCIYYDDQMCLRDLYYKLFINTVGSHVTLFNDRHYGNLYKNNIGEFLAY